MRRRRGRCGRGREDDRERARGVLERDRDGGAGLVGRLEHGLRPVERRAADAGRHVLDDLHLVEPGLERGAVLRREAHPDRQDGDRRAAPEQSIDGRLDPAGGDARDVVLAVGEHDQGRALGVGGEVLGGLLHRRDVVGVDADLLGQGLVEALAVGGGEAPQAVRELADGDRVVEQLQVGAARVIGGPRRELDHAHGRVAGDQVGGGLVDACRHALERGGESVAVRLVAEDRGRVVEDRSRRRTCRAPAARVVVVRPPLNSRDPTTITRAARMARRRRLIRPQL